MSIPSHVRPLLLLGVAACLVPAAAHADPGAGPVTGFHAAFTTHHAGAASGLRLRTTGRPPVAPTTVALAIRQTVTLPAGTRVRLARLPQCAAGDATLSAQGAEAACPAASRVGTGRAEGVLDGAPTGFDLGVYAVRGRLFFAAERDGMGLRQGFWGDVAGRRLVVRVPTLGGRIAPTLFRASLAPHAGWLRTPQRCPASGAWRFRGAFAALATVDGTTPLGPVQHRTALDTCRA